MREYVVRDEGIRPLLYIYGQYCSLDKIIYAQKKFKEDFCSLLMKYLPSDVCIKFDSVDKQIERASKYLTGKQTISLDSLYRGTCNLRISRVYSLDGGQKAFSFLTSSLDGVSIKEQVDSIPAGTYTIIEDDSVAKDTVLEMIRNLKDGETLQNVVRKLKYYETNSMLKIIGELRDDIVIEDVYLLSHYDNAYDTVDLRDFIFGVSNSGLKVDFGDEFYGRVPYCCPFISVNKRASIPENKEIEFSREICKLNKNMIEYLMSDLKLVETCRDFKYLMNKVYGQDLMIKMTEICDFISDYLDKLV